MRPLANSSIVLSSGRRIYKNNRDRPSKFNNNILSKSLLVPRKTMGKHILPNFEIKYNSLIHDSNNQNDHIRQWSAALDHQNATHSYKNKIMTASIQDMSLATYCPMCQLRPNFSITGLIQIMLQVSTSFHALNSTNSTKSWLTTIWECASTSLIRKNTKSSPNSSARCFSNNRNKHQLVQLK